ncbi:MAG: phosphodiester glycosidase family protein [Bacilli bacterium]|nr:phosphodiester glycosidase family protein [Bacilli bacterium]
MVRKRLAKKRRKKKIIKSILSLFILGISCFLFLLYGPYKGFSTWLITSAMTTMNHQYLATWFYSDEYIAKVMSENRMEEVTEETDPNQITFEIDSDSYDNDYEKQILERDENQLYKMIKINEGSLRGYLVAVYDASRVTVGTTKHLGSYGQYVKDMAEDQDAIIAINAGGFQDVDGHGTGGIPEGFVIKDSKLVWNDVPYGSMIGFNKDNVLVIGKMSAETALAKGIRDAVTFSPVLVVNGKPSSVYGNGGWGHANRTAIGQRKDGIVLLLVMDGRDYATGVPGPSMSDLIDIMLRYGAYNAANLDGGTSSNLVMNGKLINKVMNGSFQNKTRPVVTMFMVK